ncbi:hypothetical protein AMATHDRAFT_42848 [Amanita thiersii Skay4041]|uniref:F-box domain-containing protein n=1 Tax=Amanita thiersii Skay4041 TaxID=703135 RepID=A0A2A9NH25_9AGAR|nr:hypothetical protein AMATHDRAFT_42848 [Amanita thiersii Skay4041]
MSFDIPDDILALVHDAVEDPLLISSVCRAWRRFLFLRPTLWSKFNITIKKHPHLRLFRLYIDRSAQCPLSLSIVVMTMDHNIADNAAELLAWIAHRVKSLAFHMSPVALYYFERKKLTFPLLGSFDIDYVSYPNYPELFTSSPSLSKLTLTSLLTPVQHLPVIWSQITHLALYTGDNKISLLAPVLNLVSKSLVSLACVFKLQPAGSSPALAIPIEFPSLEYLHTNYPFVLDIVACPRLSSLYISTHDFRHTGWLSTSLSSFLMRSGTGNTLTSFGIECAFLTATHVMPILKFLTAVETLRLEMVQSQTVALLSTPIFLPQLTTLHVSPVLPDVKFMSTLACILDARGAGLKWVHLHYRKDMRVDVAVRSLQDRYPNIELWFPM